MSDRPVGVSSRLRVVAAISWLIALLSVSMVARAYGTTANLISNASFELGLGHGWSFYYNAPKPLNWMEPDSSTAAHGRCSLRLLRDGRFPGGYPRLLHKVIPVYPGIYTFSFYAKADRPGVVVRVEIESSPTMRMLETELTGQWQRYHITTKLLGKPCKEAALHFVVVKAPAGANAWLDAVQFERGPLSDFSPRHQVEEYIDCKQLGRVFKPGQAQLTLRCVNHRQQPTTKLFTLRVRDYYGRVVWLDRVLFELDGGERVNRVVRIPLTECGCYRLLVEAGQETVDEVVFSILPPPREIAPEESFFGAHVQLYSDYYLKLARRCGFHWLRNHDVDQGTAWYQVQPEPNQWVFNTAGYANAQQYGFKILALLYRIPSWANGLTEEDCANRHTRLGFLPRDMTLWDEYVRRTVQVFRPYVSAWELWNEVDVYQGGPVKGLRNVGTADAYSDMMRRTAPIIRQVAPEAVIVGLGGVRPAPVTRSYIHKILQSDAQEYVDVFSYHNYWFNHNEAAAYLWPEFSKYAPDKPLWNSEGSVGQGTFYRTYVSDYRGWLSGIVKSRVHTDYMLPTAKTAQMWINHMVQPVLVQRFFWYWLSAATTVLEPWSPYTLFEHDGSLRPGAVATATVARFLDGADFDGRLGIEDSKLIGQFLFNRDLHKVAVIYSIPDADLRGWISVPASSWEGIQVYDVVGGSIRPRRSGSGQLDLPIGPEPIYIVAEGGAQQRLRRVLSAANCWWEVTTKEHKATGRGTAPVHLVDQTQSDGPVPFWLVLGPLLDRELERNGPPHVELDQAKTYQGKYGQVSWQELEPRSDGYVDLDRFFETDYASAYAWVQISSPVEQAVRVLFGSDDGAAVWLNGEQVHWIDEQRSAQPGDDQFAMHLTAGVNNLVVKVTEVGGSWGFYFNVKGLEQAVTYCIPGAQLQ